MAYDFGRLADAIRDARARLGLTQEELAERAGVYVSTVQNLEGRRTFIRWPRTLGAIEIALGKREGWARAIAEGRELPPSSMGAPDQPAAVAQSQHTLIDPDSPDPVIRELSTGPVAGGPEFRQQLIRLYLDEVAEGERRARERAAARALRLAEASLGPSPEQAEQIRKLDRLEQIEREIEAEDKAKNAEMQGGGVRDSA